MCIFPILSVYHHTENRNGKNANVTKCKPLFCTYGVVHTLHGRIRWFYNILICTKKGGSVVHFTFPESKHTVYTLD